MGYTTTEDSHAAYLESQAEYDEDDLYSEADIHGDVVSQIQQMRYRYGVTKAAKVGDHIRCPTCRKEFVKRTYNQVFCSNGKQSKHSCKDRYWNFVDDSRRHRMMIMTGDIQRETVRTDVMMSNLNRETTSEVNVEELIEQLRKQPVSVLKMIKKMIS